MSIKYVICIVLSGSSLVYGMEQNPRRSLKSSKSDDSASEAIRRQKEREPNEDLSYMQQVIVARAAASNDERKGFNEMLNALRYPDEHSLPVIHNLKNACEFAQNHSNPTEVKEIQKAIAECICDGILEFPLIRPVINTIYSHSQQEFIRTQLLKLKPIAGMLHDCQIKGYLSLRKLLTLYDFKVSFEQYVSADKQYNDNTNASIGNMQSCLISKHFWADRVESSGFSFAIDQNGEENEAEQIKEKANEGEAAGDKRIARDTENFFKIVAIVEKKRNPNHFEKLEQFKLVEQGEFLVNKFYQTVGEDDIWKVLEENSDD